MAYEFGPTTVTKNKVTFDCDNCGPVTSLKFTTPVKHSSVWTGSESHTIATLCKNCHLY